LHVAREQQQQPKPKPGGGIEPPEGTSPGHLSKPGGGTQEVPGDNQTQRSAETPRTRIMGFRKPRAPIPAPDPRQSRPIRETEPSTRSDRQHDRQTHRPTEGNLTLPIGASAARSCWPAHPSSGLTSAAIEPNFFKPLPSSPSTLGSAATSCDGRARAAATAAAATVASATALALAAVNTCTKNTNKRTSDGSSLCGWRSFVCYHRDFRWVV